MMFQPDRGLAICNLFSNQFQARIFGRKLPDAPFYTLVQPTNAGLEVLGVREPYRWRISLG
jgi:hypothetical protein